MTPRIVVTGLGVITPIGLTIKDFWANLVAGKSGVGRITRFDPSRYPARVAAEVNDFDPLQYIPSRLVSRTSRFAQFAMAAATMAVASARLDMKQERPERVGVTIATIGGVHAIHEQAEALETADPGHIELRFIQKTGPHMAAVHVGRLLGAKGPNGSVSSACASGSDAIATALNHLRLGHADVMIAGGTDDTVAQLSVAAMGKIGALSRIEEPGQTPRPFDKHRDGTVVGEGSGIMVLETWEHALRRDAPVLAEMAGAGWSFDASGEVVPSPDGMCLSIKAAIEEAGIAPEAIQYVNAHGTGTPMNDVAETRALKLALGDHARRVPVSSNKSMLGHLSAAAGAVEAIASVLTIVNGVIPPTINYTTPDPECDLDYVPNTARRAGVDVCLSESFGLGGQNCCLVFRRASGGIPAVPSA